MKLRFLCQTYFRPQQQFATAASKDTACQRKQQYNLRFMAAIYQPQLPESQMIAVICKYRGVSYVIERYRLTFDI